MKILNGPPNKKRYKKWAAGTKTIGSYDGQEFSITGLSFVPSMVVAYYNFNGSVGGSTLCFKSRTISVASGSAKGIWMMEQSDGSVDIGRHNPIFGDTDVTNIGLAHLNTTISVNWWAFE